MLIDDDEDLLALMKASFEHKGYTVDARTTAPRREEILGTRPAVIIMDVSLKGENGAALCHAIKQDPGAGRTPVILISGHDADLLHEEAASGHADGCVTKPFTMQELHDLAALHAS